MANNPLPPNVTRIAPPPGSASKEASPAVESAKALPLATSSPIDFNEQALATLRASAGCSGLYDDEFALFIEMARRRRLDPFCRQIYAIVRTSKTTGQRSVTWQTSIDAFRLIADRSGKYEGQVGPYWCDANGKWFPAWLTRAAPTAARVGVYKTGFRKVLWSVARFDAYAQPGGAGLWEKMGDNQIAKCAEALALRRAFPEDLGGLYIREEMEQAGEELVGEVVHRDVKPENDSFDAPPPAPPIPPPAPEPHALLPKAEQNVIEMYAEEFARVRSVRERDNLCFDVRRAAGERTSPAFKRWFCEMTKQADAAIGTPSKGAV